MAWQTQVDTEGNVRCSKCSAKVASDKRKFKCPGCGVSLDSRQRTPSLGQMLRGKKNR